MPSHSDLVRVFGDPPYSNKCYPLPARPSPVVPAPPVLSQRVTNMHKMSEKSYLVLHQSNLQLIPICEHPSQARFSATSCKCEHPSSVHENEHSAKSMQSRVAKSQTRTPSPTKTDKLVAIPVLHRIHRWLAAACAICILSLGASSSMARREWEPRLRARERSQSSFWS